jgi:hypothetical protein
MDFCPSVLIHEDIAHMEVAVNDSLVVHVCQPLCNASDLRRESGYANLNTLTVDGLNLTYEFISSRMGRIFMFDVDE